MSKQSKLLLRFDRETNKWTSINKKPKKGIAEPTWEHVIADMALRDVLGESKYGTRHQHDNGRNHLLDAYEECLDMACYLKAEIMHREANNAGNDKKRSRRKG